MEVNMFADNLGQQQCLHDLSWDLETHTSHDILTEESSGMWDVHQNGRYDFQFTLPFWFGTNHDTLTTGRSRKAGAGYQMAESTVCCKDTPECPNQEWYLRVDSFPPADLNWHHLYEGFSIRSARR